ncbi:MAG: GGDEF domain-containing protein [Pseudomonadota bacterium]
MPADFPGRFLSRFARPGARRERHSRDLEESTGEAPSLDPYALDDLAAPTVEKRINRTTVGGVLAYPVAAVVVGPDIGNFVNFAMKDDIIIGRDPGADLLLTDPGVSRKHARVTWRDDNKFLVEDLGSTNGVHSQGRQLDEDIVAPGTVIDISDSSIILQLLSQDRIEHMMKVNAKMQQADGRDPLTHLHTRLFLDEQLPDLVSFHRRESHKLCCLFLDLDHFKDLNDTYGHPLGDSVLKQVAHLVVQACRQEDHWVRYGGEELVGFLPNTDEETAWLAAERVRAFIEEHDWSRNRPGMKVTCSIGLSRLRPGEPVESWIGRADEALYLAKRNGRNRVERSD